MLRTKQNLALICFSHFHMFASKLSINDKTACLKTWFSCGRTRSFHYFLESSRSFSFSYLEPFICEEVCAKFSRSVVRASWRPKQPTALDWFTCGTTHPFMFPDKLPIFLSLVSWICPLLLQSLWVNESLRQSTGERLLKPVNILLSSSLRTRAVSRAFLNQCKGAWKGGRSYAYELICWLVHYLLCYVITTRENYNPSLQLCVGWSWALHESFVGKFKEVMEGIKEMNSLNVSTIHY